MYSGFVQKAWRSGMTGMAGNLRVASELLLRELYVSLPTVDCGVDLEVEGLVRIQVKSAHAMRLETEHQQAGYNFSLSRGPRALGGGLATKATPRNFSDKCHFVVLWGIEQNRFWIVPSAMLDGRMTVYLGPEGRWLPTSEAYIKSLLESGMTQRDVAAALGLSEMTISRRVNKIFTQPSPVVAGLTRIRACEGRWDQIAAYIATMRQAEQVVTQVEASSVTIDGSR